MTNHFDLPFMGYGLGLRSKHYSHILEHKPNVDWFEVISENFMEAGGKPRRILGEVRDHYPVVMHGVGMSIGSTDPLDKDYLYKLKELAKWLQPAWISDHLCWTGINHQNSHDLLPVPYTEEALKHIVTRIKEVQDYMERVILFENPSTYMEFTDSSMSEAAFIRHMADEADCALLLDINNIYVTCYNHRLDPKEYIDQLPLDRVVQIHLAGHDNQGTHIVDTHDNHVIDDVWKLYQYTVSKIGNVSTMVEWDDNIPEFDVLLAEVNKAKAFANQTIRPNDLPNLYEDNKHHYEKYSYGYSSLLEAMHKAVIKGNKSGEEPVKWIKPKNNFLPEEQLNVYVKAYRYRLFNVTDGDYSALRSFLGDERMNRLLWDFIAATPSSWFNINNYVYQLPKFMQQNQGVIGDNSEFAYELAKVESIISQYFSIAEQTNALKRDELQSLSPEEFMGMKIRLKGSATMIALNYDVHEFLNHYYRNDDDSRLPEPSKLKNFLLIYRNKEEVWRIKIDEGQYYMLNFLNEGKNIGEALEAVLEESDASAEEIIPQMQQWFTSWMDEAILAHH